MKKTIEENNRRSFLKKCGLSTVPFLLPTTTLHAMPWSENNKIHTAKNSETAVNFVYDGLELSPREYLQVLTDIDQEKPLEPDFYGNGGSTKQLEEEFAKLTGKEKAMYLPTGTMANQLAIKLLNGNNTKVIVPDNSHVFRDEADASQSVHRLRLVPTGKDKPYFQLEDLKNTVKYINKNEVFKSGLGTVVIENPIRRANGTAVPIETIKEVSAYCKKNGLKYLNANGGAMLCGDVAIIDQLSHQIKILGGTTFQNWNNTAIALYFLEGITERLNQVVVTANKLIEELNKIDGISISSIENGTNIYTLQLANNISSKELAKKLFEEYNIRLRSSENDMVRFAVNESLLTRDLEEVINAWKTVINQLRK